MIVKEYCPVCGNRLIDREDTVKNLLAPMIKNIKIKWHPDYYTKCGKCKKIIAIKKIG